MTCSWVREREKIKPPKYRGEQWEGSRKAAEGGASIWDGRKSLAASARERTGWGLELSEGPEIGSKGLEIGGNAAACGGAQFLQGTQPKVGPQPFAYLRFPVLVLVLRLDDFP